MLRSISPGRKTSRATRSNTVNDHLQPITVSTMRPTCRGATRREIFFSLLFMDLYQFVPTPPNCAYWSDRFNCPSVSPTVEQVRREARDEGFWWKETHCGRRDERDRQDGRPTVPGARRFGSLDRTPRRSRCGNRRGARSPRPRGWRDGRSHADVRRGRAAIQNRLRAWECGPPGECCWDLHSQGVP